LMRGWSKATPTAARRNNLLTPPQPADDLTLEIIEDELSWFLLTHR
jgi:hypothetical protein